MCILIVKRAGVKFPAIENIQNSCDNNPNGFSMAWLGDDKLQTFRCMSKADFLQKYKELSNTLSYKKTPMIIHARIATHGTINVNNTHCWTDNELGIAFAHNGVLSISNRDDMTDSETFFRDIFIPVYRSRGWDGATLAINAVIGSSKFAFLDRKGTIRYAGNFVDEKGVLYSNTSYLKRSYVSSGYGSSSVYSGYGSKWGGSSPRTSLDYDREWANAYYDAKAKCYVYRPSGITDAEWKKRKQDYYDSHFYDYETKNYVFRDKETDEEWAYMRDYAKLYKEEMMQAWRESSSTLYDDDEYYYD